MRLFSRWWMLLSLLLTLSGCFRQAGESLEPITNPSPVPQQTEPVAVTPLDTTSLTDFPATATFPPVTVIQPPTSELPLVETTQAPAGSPTTDTRTGATTLTPAFITPDSPIGPIVIDTPTPTPVMSPTNTPSGLTTPTALFTGETDPCAYTVKTGDNLFRIAVNHDVSLEELRAANPEIFGDLIQPGQVLRIPNCTASGTPTSATATLTTTVGGTPGVQIHVVQPGETLLAIARQYGVTVEDLIIANNLSDPNRLSVGQELIIP